LGAFILLQDQADSISGRPGLWLGSIAAFFSGDSPSIVGAARPEAARTALAARDFLAVYQRVVIFDLLGMVSATVRARGHLSLVELHLPMVCAARPSRWVQLFLHPKSR
jgi:hypothetical protein